MMDTAKMYINSITMNRQQFLSDEIFQNLKIIGIVLMIGVICWLVYNVNSKKKACHNLNAENKRLKSLCLSYESTIEENEKDKRHITEKYEELKKSQDHIKKLAYSDYLTQLPNRVAFTEILDNVLFTLRQEEVIAVMDIDIDDFKVINDTLGHSYGDELLIDVTHRLKQAITEDDYLARIGGDEFIILSQNLSDIGQYEDKVKLIMKVFSYPFVLSTKEFFVTVSIGIAIAPTNGKTSQAIIKNVDTAMYVAKANGKNTYYYFDESMNKRLMKKIQMQSELRKAIEEREFCIYYQPQISLADDKLVGFEALIRWIKADGTIVSPLDFIPLAEETGLIIPIGQYVLIEACKELKYWNDKGYSNLRMAINLSVRQFKDQDFVQMLTDIIDEVKVNPYNLELEITETIALEDIDFTIKTITLLQKIGVKFSLDDFGTGYSSMNYLKRLPVNVLKIDKSFLDTIMEDESDQKIVQTIISMAQVLKLEVVAEGVENEAQAQYLKKVNCDKAQGYLYSKPIPSREAYEMIRQYHKAS